MSGIYSVDDLLKLRASPLICRPANLPPIEEWMGAQDTTARRPATTRGKPDEPVVQTETFQKRPALLESQRRTTTDPDRIVLGPPRRSFASSNARAAGKGPEGLEESNTRDRTSFHEKSRNGDVPEDRHHERRNMQTNGRHGVRQEGEDIESATRRELERRPKWAGRDKNDQALEDEEDSSRASFRRDRGKLSQPWFRKENADALEESGRDGERPQDWRRDRRDKEWDRSAKVEAEPEWMDAAEPEEPFQARTQEDFQRWKEKMKAGTATPTDRVEQPASTEAIQEASAKKIASPEPDDSMDKFFARFESKGQEQKPATVKMHGKTRFASLFSPAPEQSKQVEAPPRMPTSERPSSAQLPGSSGDADQAGFARILEMLQTRSHNPTPQSQETAKPRTPLYARGTEPRPEMEGRPSSQSLISILTGQNLSQQQEPTPMSQDRFTDPGSSAPQPAHTRQQSSINKDEVLLNLLRQASLAPKPEPPNPHQQSGSGMYGIPGDPNARAAGRNHMISPVQGQGPMPGQRREASRSMFDESPVSVYPNESGPREHIQRRPTEGTHSGQEDPLIALLRGQAAQRPMQPQGPPGLQRPPGLDQVPRPGQHWPTQPPQPQQPPQRQTTLPPGLSAAPRGMAGGPFGQPQQIPTQQNVQPPPPQQRAQQQRKYTGESSSAPGMPNLPPGMYPPPGFMNAGPPPGFPGAMANHPARYQGEPGPQGANRGFMEMYGEVGGRGVGLRGGAGNGPMPPFR
ncbi:hypothetical protein PV11_03323 [Exophiala sideris]|uniref:Uncharacterized protein n=2 Tax=Exophiala sideris TaxID=1016849 RepID=A0A0D1XHY4_9EURO|nr:hypothetical protein PV11_03323 [Exophiala sideris]